MKGICLVLGLILISCSQKIENESHTRELIPNPEKYEHDNYSPDKISFVPDTSINLISLLSSKYVEKYLGKNLMDKLDHDAVFPNTMVYSKDRKQILTIYLYPGGVRNEFDLFEISYIKDRSKKHQIIVDDKEFITESGIKLGLTIGQLKTIKGEPDTICKKENSIVCKYEIIDMEKSAFLKRYNMTKYFADYSFINGYLEEFKFGFEYP